MGKGKEAGLLGFLGKKHRGGEEGILPWEEYRKNHALKEQEGEMAEM